MKRILLISTLLVIAVSLSFSQMAYHKDQQVINLGIGLGGFAGAYGSGGIAITGGYEYGVNENISLGGVVGYSSSSEDFGAGYGYKYTYILIAARGAYHLDLFHNPKIDTYGGLLLGYNIVSNSTTGLYYGYGSASASYLEIGLFAGGRYYFDPHWAVQAELGYGLGILNIGIAYKL
jgi:YadA-like C-terminal region.